MSVTCIILRIRSIKPKESWQEFDARLDLSSQGLTVNKEICKQLDLSDKTMNSELEIDLYGKRLITKYIINDNIKCIIVGAEILNRLGMELVARD